MISIVVPIYKVENYLPKCIESVLAQTFSDWELILVDDGSPDKSGEICDNYALRDGRIKVIHKGNGGVSSARNEGIDKAKGEWICFLDSDDWWSPHFLENFTSHFIEADLVMQGYTLEDEINGIQLSCNLPKKLFKSAAEVISFLEGYPNFHNGFIWHRLFKSSIIKKENIRFPEGISFAEDGLFFLNYMRSVKISLAVEGHDYHYRRISGSLTSSFDKQSEATYHYLIEGYLQNLDLISKSDILAYETTDSLKQYGWRLLIAWVINKGMNNIYDYRKMVSYMRTLINKYNLTELHKTTIIHRLLISACMNGQSVLSMMIVKYLCILRSRETWKQKCHKK